MNTITLKKLPVWIGIAAILTLSITVIIYQRLSPPAISPTMYIQTDNNLKSIAFVDNGKLLVTNDETGMVAYRNAVTGVVTRKWQGDKWQNTTLSNDGRYELDTIDMDDTCILRDALTGTVLRKWQGNVECIAPDFSIALVHQQIPGKNRQLNIPITASLQDVVTGKTIAHFQTTSMRCHWMKISSDKHWLYSPDPDGESLLYHIPELSVTKTLPPLSSLKVSHDGKRIFGVHRDKYLRIWDMSTGKQTTITTGIDELWWVSETDNGNLLLGGDRIIKNRCLFCVDIRSEDGSRSHKFIEGMDSSLTSDGRLIVIYVDPANAEPPNKSGISPYYAVIDTKHGKTVATLDADPYPIGLSALNSGLDHNISLSPDGKKAVSITRSGLIRIYDITSPNRKNKLYISNDSGRSIGNNDYQNSEIKDAVVLPNNGMAMLWQQRGDEPGFYAAVYRQGKQQSTYKDILIQEMPGITAGMVDSRIWNCAIENIAQQPLIPHQITIGNDHYKPELINASPDGKYLVVTWELDQPKTKRLHPTKAKFYALTELRDAKTGKIIHAFDDIIPGAYSPVPCAWSKNDKMLAVSGGDGVIKLWDTTTGRRLGQFAGSVPDWITGAEPQSALVAFSPDDKYLAAARSDGPILLYSMASHLPIAQIGNDLPPKHLNSTYWIGFDQDGKTVYKISADGHGILSWPVPI